MIIALDFDGTVVSHEYPKMGRDIGSVIVLKRLIDNGHQLILNTMRSEINYINDAITWFVKNDIPLYAIGENPTQKTWTITKKVYADLIIDDSAIGIPLKYNPNISLRKYVDWEKLTKMLEDMKLI